MKIQITELNTADAGDCEQLVRMGEGLLTRFRAPKMNITCANTEDSEEIERLLNVNKEHQDKIIKLRVENQKAIDTLELQYQEIRDLQQERDGLLREKKDPESELEKRKDVIVDMGNQICDLVKENERLQQEINGLLKEKKGREAPYTHMSRKCQHGVVEPFVQWQQEFIKNVATKTGCSIDSLLAQMGDTTPAVMYVTKPENADKLRSQLEPNKHAIIGESVIATPEQVKILSNPKPITQVKSANEIESPETEKRVKSIRKPKGKERPERAKVFEAPGECLHCSLVACTDAGWFCKDAFRALPVDAEKCKSFVSGVPEGKREPEPPPAPVDTEAETPPTVETPEPETAKARTEAAMKADGDDIREKMGAPQLATPTKEETPPPAPSDKEPEEFFKKPADTEADPDDLRQQIRTESRMCLQNPEFKKKFPGIIATYSDSGQINSIPEDKLQQCLNDLRELRQPGSSAVQKDIEF